VTVLGLMDGSREVASHLPIERRAVIDHQRTNLAGSQALTPGRRLELVSETECWHQSELSCRRKAPAGSLLVALSRRTSFMGGEDLFSLVAIRNRESHVCWRQVRC
jgi:hypothetical protein